MSKSSRQKTKNEAPSRRPSARCGALIESARDLVLVQRCLRGERAAWDDLYHECHPTLLATAMAMYADRPDRRQAGEEIAARVWYQLIAEDFRLLRLFAAERGCRLNAYLAGICRHQTLNFLKEERHRRVRERTSGGLDSWQQAESQAAPNDHDFGIPAAHGMGDFQELLTPTERRFYVDVLLADSAARAEQDYSAANIRQLRSRIRRKLLRFLRS